MNLIFYIILFVYFFLPFQFALSPADGFDIAIIRVLIICTTTLFFAYSLWQKKLFIPRGWIMGFLCSFILWTALSLFFTPVPIWTLRKIIFLFSFIPLVFILVTLFRIIPKARKDILRWSIYGATAISIIGIIQFLLQFIFSLNTILALWTFITTFFLGGTFSASVIAHNSWLVHVGHYDIMRAIAFFPDPHIFAFYLELIAPYALGLFFMTKQKIWIFCFFVLLIADILTFSRGGYIGIISGIVIGIILLWPQIKTRSRHFIILFCLSCAFFILIPGNPITSRLLSSFDDTDTSNTHRIELWTTALHSVIERPVIGTGLGAYAITVDPRATYRTPIYAHNLLLDITVELGIIGLLLFCGIFFKLIYTFYKNRHDYIALFAIISISAFFFHAIFDTPLFSVHVFPILLLIISLGIYYENPTNKK